MTNYNKASLKTFFETNDVPTGSDYANFIDSCVNLVETTAQNMAGPLSTTELITPKISANALNINQGALKVNIDGTVSADDFYSGAVATGTLTVNGASQFSGLINADATALFNSSNFFFGRVSTTVDVSANTNTVYASAVRAPSGYFGNSVTPIVSAAGTTQGAATILTTSPIVRGQGTADGATTGYAIPANRIGLVQQFVHEGAVSGNLWPPTGGVINALAANAAFALAANTMYTIVHKTASAYAVK